jgi:hypothetical protein
MSDALSVLWNDFGPDRTKEVSSEGNYIAAGIQCFGVGMCIDDCFVDGSECPARSAFVVLPEPRGKAVDELQPRRRFVKRCQAFESIVGALVGLSGIGSIQTRTSVLRVLKTLVVKKGR